MATVNLNSQNFQETIENNDLVFVDFWATWCRPCKAFGPIYQKASEANSDIVFGKVDIDQCQDLAAAADIQAVPTLMIAKQGQIIFKQAGALRASDLDDVISQARAVNLEEAAEETAK
ncbi:thioredoxin [Bombiscardovia apis]|uniref:Thioredoxin n=1 Tax=Bombiscardovia apis TaxID=2932182 RepID=A0ABN6SEZ6_9BIFI|nr:thioredoxin [Bombiscardovia apis]BDR54248.1 thioredoxin [Bombiscardovia apis]